MKSGAKQDWNKVCVTLLSVPPSKVLILHISTFLLALAAVLAPRDLLNQDPSALFLLLSP